MTVPDQHTISSTETRYRPWQTVRVWDLFVRLFHWALVAAVSVAASTGFLMGSPWLNLHVIAGTTMAGLLVARIIWGFYGGGFARFSGFVVGPRKALAHLRELRAGSVPRHLGHNPLGGLMIIALLAVGAGLALTGAVALGGVFKTGPLAFVTSYDVGRLLRQLHEFLAWGLLGLIALHIAGVIAESLRTRDNLASAMITGDKPRRQGDHRPPRVRSMPWKAAGLVATIFAASLIVVVRLDSAPPLGVPQASLDPAYVAECGACHMVYHPSLLPTAAWHALFAGLDDHFGEDASLPDATVAALEAYAVANAAETVDTKPAHVLSRTDPADPFRITATPFWKRTHTEIPAATFKSPAVMSSGNCAACHGDASTGRFHPSRIHIPDEVQS